MININKLTKKRQTVLFTVIAVVVLIILGSGYFFLMNDKGAKKKQLSPTPNFTGAINYTFDDKTTSNVMRDYQGAARDIDRKYDNLKGEVTAKASEISNLKSIIDKQDSKIKQLNEFYNKKFDELERSIKNKSNSTINIDMNDPLTSRGQPYYSTQFVEKKIVSLSVNQSLTKVTNNLPYIPSGSFAKAIIIEGADANASVTGNNNTNPIQFTITGKVIMPNDYEYDLTGCFVTGEVYGDISSERGEVRTRNISCRFDDDNKKTIDMPFKGHVSFMGKNGIKGIPIMRNGKIIAWAGAAGFIDGLGKGAESAAGTTVGVGATNSVGAGEVFRSALGGGTSKAASTLSDYYIKRAEQYHPIIEIGSGNEVTVMFHDGFQLKYISDTSKELLKNNKITDKSTSLAMQQQKQQQQQIQQQLRQLQPQPQPQPQQPQDTTNETLNNEDINKLKNLYLNDFME